MREPTTNELANLLAGQDLGRRSGVVELPIACLGIEGDIAVTLGAGHCDICKWKLDHVPVGRSRFGLRWDGIISDLLKVLLDLSIPGYCIWVSNIDVLLAGIPHPDRSRFWEFMRLTCRPSRGLLISMPIGASHIFPNEERALWLEYGRLCGWMPAWHDQEVK